MTRLLALTRIVCAAGMLAAMASACGGQSFSAGNDGSDAGSSQGGTSSKAGSTGAAGKGHAGRSNGGTGAGGTGAGGTGNVAGAAGTATAGTGTAGSPDYGACAVAGDCMIRGTGCCGVCDAPNLTTKDFMAFNRAYASVFECGVPLPAVPASGGAGNAGATAPIACAPCPAPPAGQGTLQYFVPDCIRGQCVAEDLRTSPVTACKSSDECKVRHGTGCCESCGTGDNFAVRNDGSFEKLVCGSGPVPCLACAPAPSGAIAECDTSVGHCTFGAPTQTPTP